VYADAIELQHAFINLAFHATGAIPVCGTLLVQTSREVNLPPLSQPASVTPRPPVAVLIVTNRGPGTPCEAFKRPAGNPDDPAALRLYQARHFAEKCGGAIEHEGGEGPDATLRLFLPLASLSESDETWPVQGAEQGG
jgi:signal transduction histidine kinase